MLNLRLLKERVWGGLQLFLALLTDRVVQPSFRVHCCLCLPAQNSTEKQVEWNEWRLKHWVVESLQLLLYLWTDTAVNPNFALPCCCQSPSALWIWTLVTVYGWSKSVGMVQNSAELTEEPPYGYKVKFLLFWTLPLHFVPWILSPKQYSEDLGSHTLWWYASPCAQSLLLPNPMWTSLVWTLKDRVVGGDVLDEVEVWVDAHDFLKPDIGLHMICAMCDHRGQAALEGDLVAVS